MIRLAEERELKASLGGEDGGGAAPKTAVVDSGDGRVVVGELRLELRGGDERGF